MADTNRIEVEVAYARPDKQKIIVLSVTAGTTALQAAELSGITDEFPEIDLGTAKLGLFGKHFGTKGIKPADEYVLQARDRVEIYRPLIADPKEVRRKRAEKAKAEKEAAKKPQ
jgi:putative ubiquitin-RnfH superfamily antitoxin RatB of RatAB toxin-antitoxin module